MSDYQQSAVYEYVLVVLTEDLYAWIHKMKTSPV